MPNSLLLIPTKTERQWAATLLDSLPPNIVVELCGFGPIVAGIRTAQLIAQHRPQHVWLVGIAGAIDKGLEIGTAYEFDEVACYGIGVGCGSNFQTASDMGWNQWSSGNSLDDSPTIAETLQLQNQQPSLDVSPRQLLSVCAASSNAQEVAWRLQKFPHAVAEDMEGFAVAAACTLAQVPLRIVRGLSNMAGDRDHQSWQSAGAMQAAVTSLLAQVERT